MKSIIIMFLKSKKENDIYALFPQSNDVKYLDGYSHIGQHSSIHRDYVRESTLAKKGEYEDLKKELIGLGYKDPIIVNEL